MSGNLSIPFSGAGIDINFAVPDASNADILQILVNNQPFPKKEITLLQSAIKLTTAEDIVLGDLSNKVIFSAGASAAIGIYQNGANLVTSLKTSGLQEQIIDGLTLPSDTNKNFAVMRWGYNIGATASGSIALGSGGVRFGADGKIAGLFAVIRQLDNSIGARDVLTDTINSWVLPKQVSKLEDLKPGTWIVAETDGSLSLSLGAQFGYNFNWIRKDLKLGGLTGDIGLKINAGISATLGASIEGNYGIVLGRTITTPNVLRLQIFKLNKLGWSFAFNAAANVQFNSTTLVPGKLDDFIKGVLNIQGLQILDDLKRWLDPNTKLANMLGEDLVNYAKDLLSNLTGIDPQAAFDDALGEVRSLIKEWQKLPHELSATIYDLLPEQQTVTELRDFLKHLISENDNKSLQTLIAKEIEDVNFFRTGTGQWLIAASRQELVQLLSNTQLLNEVKSLASQTLLILDGSKLETTLISLQKWINQHLGLDKITAVVDQESFKKLDGWLKVRISDFIGRTPVFEDIKKLKDAINQIRNQAQNIFAKARETLTRKYEVTLNLAYQNSSTTTALIDIEFDFQANPNVSQFLKQALSGDFTDLLLNKKLGVKLNKGVLTHSSDRKFALEFTIPFFTNSSTSVIDALASFTAIDSDGGSIFAYDLKAFSEEDRRSGRSKEEIRNIRNSRLAIGLNFQAQGSLRQFSSSANYQYSLKIAQRNMKLSFLQYQLKPIVTEYFPSQFGANLKGSYDLYIAALDAYAQEKLNNGLHNLGDTLISLDVSLSSKALKAWEKAPASQEHPIYMTMSIVIQRVLRQLIPTIYFQDPKNYGTSESAFPLLVYIAVPPRNNVVLQSDGTLKGNEKDIHWYMNGTNYSALRTAIINHSSTKNNLKLVLANVRSILSTLPEMHDKLGFYEDSQINTILSQVSSKPTLFDSLVFVEKDIIKNARDTGIEFAKLNGQVDKNPDKAIEILESFGHNLVKAFHEKMTSIYNGNTLRSLGTLVYLEVVKCLNNADKIDQSAILNTIILKNGIAQTVLENFISGTEPSIEQILVQQKIVSVL